MPTARLICSSHAFDLGMDLSRKCRDVIQSEKYRKVFPKVKIRDDQNTKGYFANDKGGMRFVATVGGKSPIGMHAHFLITDDPIDPQAASSEADLLAANNWMSETLPSRKVSKLVTVSFLIMQRIHQNDPTGHRLAKGERAGRIKHVQLPADLREGYEIIPESLAKYYVDELMDPVRLNRFVLMEARGILGEFGYAGQYGQSPVPRSGGMFKIDRLKHDTPPDFKQFKKLVRYWDKAATPDGGAFTVGVLMGRDMRDEIWVLDVVRGQWDSDRRESIIKATAKLDGKGVRIGLEQEPGSGGKDSAKATVRNLMGYRVHVDPVGSAEGNKILRADPFSSQVNARNVNVRKDAPWLHAYIEELRFFPSSTYKDQVDASSGAFNMIANVKRKLGAL